MTMRLTSSPLAIEKREAKKSGAEKKFECNTQYFTPTQNFHENDWTGGNPR